MSLTRFDIGEADLADAPILQRIIADAFRQYETIIPPHIYDAYIADLHDIAGRMETAEVLVARAGDELVGTVTFYGAGDPGGHGRPDGRCCGRSP
jgi:hypothetical protein